MANEFKVKNGLIVIGELTTSGTITINGALAATQSWVTSQAYLTSSSLTSYATQSYVTSAIASLVDSAPGALDTLRELATALGNDASFSTTVTNSIAAKLPLAGGTLTGALTGTSATFSGAMNADSYGMAGAIQAITWTTNTLRLGQGTYWNNVELWDGSAIRLKVASGGNVGIGTTSPDTPLVVQGGSAGTGGWNRTATLSATYPGLIFNSNGTKWGGMAYDYSAAMRFWVNASSNDIFAGTLAMSILNNGNVGIGTSDPGFKLEVNGGAIGNNIARFTTGGVGGGTRGLTMYSDNSQVKLQVTDNAGSQGTWAFLNLNPDGGYVGIGTTAPSTKLEVGNFLDAVTNKITVAARYEYEPEFNFRLGQSGTNYDWVGAVISSGDDGNYNGKILFKTANAGRDTPTTKMAIKANGNVGIGTVSPSEKLDVLGNIKIYNETGLITDYGPLIGRYNTSQIYIGTGGSYSIIKIGRDDGAALNVLSGGTIGIGTTSPVATLSVVGTVNLGAQASGFYNTNSVLHIAKSGVAQITFEDYQVTAGIAVAASVMSFGNQVSDATYRFKYNNVYNGNFASTGTTLVQFNPTTSYISAGNFGIGTTTPQKKLDVNGNGIVASFGTTISPGQFAGIHFGYSESASNNDSYKKSALVFERTDNHGQGGNASGKIHFLLNNIASASATSLSHSVMVIDTDSAATQGSARVGIGTTSPSTALTVNGVITATGGNSTNWNSAYSWGNHASAGYLTSVSDIWVNTAGDTMTGTLLFAQPVGLGFANGQYIKDNSSGGLIINSGAAVNINGTSVTINGNTAWHSGNDGSGSGLDADLLDGIESSRMVYGQSGTRRGTNLITNWNQNDYPDVAFLSAEGGGTNAPSGDYSYGMQYSFHRSGAAYRTQFVTSLYSDLDVWVRNSRDSDVFTSWKRLWHSGDFTSTNVSNWNTAYGWGNHASVGYITSAGSISGNAATATYATSAGALSSMNISQFTNNSGYITGISFASVSSKPTTISGYGITDALYQNRDTINVDAFNATGLYRGSTSGWSNRPTISHNGGALLTIDTHPSDYHSQLFFDTGADRLYFRNANGGVWGSWLIMFHTGNYTSYVPTLTGTGASGTWNINVTGSAGSISGFNNPATGATANTIVYRDSSGDIYGRYIFGSYHNSSDNVDTGSITYIMAKFGDNYHRSATAAKVQAFLGLGSLAYSSATIPTNNNQLTNGADYIVKGTQVLSAASWTTATRFGSVGDISQDAGNHALSVRSENGNDAFMSFHIGGDYAVHFGLDDATNRLHTGGWSDGAVKYQLWDSRDFTSSNVSNWNTAYSWGNHASYSYATTSYVTTQINNLINGAPGALDTLNELATALGNDASFSTTVTNSIATKLPLAGGTMSGNLQVNAKVGTLDNQGIYLRGIGDATHKIYYRTSDGGNVWEYNSPIKFEYYNSGIPLTRLTLDIAGNLTIGGFLTESSSIKLKENVETSGGNLEKVVNLRPVTYNKIGSQTKELGLIAEEVAEVYPEFVQYDESGEPVGVNYSRLTAALIGAVKELTQRIETLENNG